MADTTADKTDVKPTGIVARRSPEDMLREQRDRLNQEARERQAQEEQDYKEAALAESQKCAQLREQITEAIPLALKRLEAKNWGSAYLRTVTFWDGTFKRKGIRALFQNQIVYVEQELAVWSVPNISELYLLSNGHLGLNGMLKHWDGEFVLGKSHHGGSGVAGIVDSQKVVDDWLNTKFSRYLQSILNALNSL